MNGGGIIVEHLTKRFGTKVAVNDASFEVSRGSIVGLLGFNGAGKSTTMDMLATLTKPTSGRAIVAGEDVTRLPLAVRRKMSIVFESAAPPRPSWTVREYLAFFQALRGAPAPPASLLNLLDIGELRDQTTGTLSAGQRKRVEIARAMAAKPDVLLLDEPTKEVDMKGKRVVWEAVRAHASAGATVLVCSHDVMEVRELCDRVLVMHEGRIIAELERPDVRSPDIAALEALLVAHMEGRHAWTPHAS